jgi:hypothetical protein
MMALKNTENLSNLTESSSVLQRNRNPDSIRYIRGLLLSMIAMHVERILMRVPRKTISLWMAALILISTGIQSQADLGWTLDQFKQRYGNPVLNQEQIAGRVGYVFTGEDYVIAAFFRNTQVSRILYICRGSSAFDWERTKALLRANAPDANWDDASKNEADNSYRVDGIKDGRESYHASLADNGKMLAIWTQEDDEAVRTKPDTPPVASGAGSTEKTTGEVSPGDAARELTPENNHPDVPANATSSSPAQRLASHSSRTKIAKVRFQSSMSSREIRHAANFTAKAQSTASSPQHVGGYHPAPTPLLMNAGTGLYNSDYTQPFKNQKKTPSP